MKHRKVLQEPANFQDAVEPFLRACPGPALAERGLRMVAYQRVPGIPGLELAAGVEGAGARKSGRPGNYLRSLVEVAARVHCSPTYLSDAALRRGYSCSRALRWLRFLHGRALEEAGVPVSRMIRSLGFNDPAGWSRFTKALIGRSPSQIPTAAMEFWVRIAIEDVYLGHRRGLSGRGFRDDGGSKR